MGPLRHSSLLRVPESCRFTHFVLLRAPVRGSAARASRTWRRRQGRPATTLPSRRVHNLAVLGAKMEIKTKLSLRIRVATAPKHPNVEGKWPSGASREFSCCGKVRRPPPQLSLSTRPPFLGWGAGGGVIWQAGAGSSRGWQGLLGRGWADLALPFGSCSCPLGGNALEGTPVQGPVPAAPFPSSGRRGSGL